VPEKPPWCINHYTNLLQKGKDARVEFVPLPCMSERRVHIALRHDVDAVPDNCRLFLDAEVNLGLSACYYFIVDRIVPSFPYSYEFEACQAIVREIMRNGGRVGLHSIAWAHENGLSLLLEERRRFEKLVGCAPQAQTFHGYMPADITQVLRAKFLRKYRKENRIPFSETRHVIASDSEGRSFPASLNFDALCVNYPYEFMTHPEYWAP